MLLIDIEVPFLENSYDFEIAEELLVKELAGVLFEQILLKEQLDYQGNLQELMLVSLPTGRMLLMEQSIGTQVTSGERLLLL